MEGNSMKSLLEQMRATRDAREDEVRAPVLKALHEETRQKEIAVNKYHQIEFKLSEDIIKHAMDLAKDELARLLIKQLAEKVSKNIDMFDGGTLSFHLPKSTLRTASPDKILDLVLSEYTRQSKPYLKIEAKPIDTTIEMIEIVIPQLNLRVDVNRK